MLLPVKDPGGWRLGAERIISYEVLWFLGLGVTLCFSCGGFMREFEIWNLESGIFLALGLPG